MTMATAKDKRRKEAKALLEGFWGNVFNFSNPKPLKTGIEEDLLDASEALGLPFDGDVIKRALSAYVYNLRYFHALAKGGARYDLQGQKSGEVTEEERLEAKASIKRCYERSEEKKRNRVIEAENQAKAKARKNAARNAYNGNKLSG
ncbi:TPA: ProQ/FinO family protein [Morganella morganii]|jgi:ProP effector|nr:ProQ/FinO family protein [Morganella morganii]